MTYALLTGRVSGAIHLDMQQAAMGVRGGWEPLENQRGTCACFFQRCVVVLEIMTVNKMNRLVFSTSRMSLWGVEEHES